MSDYHMPTVLDLADWKKRVQGGDDGTETIVRKQAVANAEDVGQRRIKFTISTGDVDRENDRLSHEPSLLKNTKAHLSRLPSLQRQT
jgi:hypothetical protein